MEPVIALLCMLLLLALYGQLAPFVIMECRHRASEAARLDIIGQLAVQQNGSMP